MRYFALFCLFSLIGCSKDSDDFSGKTANKLYSTAMAHLEERDYSDAASTFKEVETLFPYSNKSNAAQVLSAYCHFLDSNYKM